MKNIFKRVIVVLLMGVVLCLCACSQETFASDIMKVSYLDVGQADCTIIKYKDKTVVIDTGNRGDYDAVKNFLNKEKVKSIDYMIATHSHEDHVGSMADIIKEFPTKKLVMPKEEKGTSFYNELLDTASKLQVTVVHPKNKEKFSLGEPSIQIINPKPENETDINDTSLSILVKNGKHKFLFTGDSTEKREKAFLEAGVDLVADVFQVGHHGGATSNSQKFLETVDPVYALISCGNDNSYGHPHVETLARLDDLDVLVYRTDKQGTSIVTSDGKELKWSFSNSVNDIAKEINKETDKETGKETDKETGKGISDQKDIYVININTKRYHIKSCASVNQMSEKNRKEVNESPIELVKQGYLGCGNCIK